MPLRKCMIALKKTIFQSGAYPSNTVKVNLCLWSIIESMSLTVAFQINDAGKFISSSSYFNANVTE